MASDKKQQFIDALGPIIARLDGLPVKPNSADILNEEFAVDANYTKAIAELFEQGVAEGWLCDRQGGEGVSFSRVAKGVGARKFSIDAVRMNRPGPGHTHPSGEFDLCMAVEGSPRFDGNEPGWTVYDAKSWHVPTVEGGTMNILYFLPGGEIQFGDKPNESIVE